MPRKLTTFLSGNSPWWLCWVPAIALSTCVFGLSAPNEQAANAGPDAAAPSVEEAIQLAREEIDRLAGLHSRDERLPGIEAVTKYTDIIKTAEPSNPWLLYLYGRMNALIARNGDARDYLRKFVETPEGRNEWTAYRALGELFSAEFPRLAKLNYKRARELRGDEASILYGLSVCELRLSELNGALQLAQEAVAADGGKTIRFLSHLAQVYMARKNWHDAVSSADTAFRLADEALKDSPGRQSPVQFADEQCQLLIQAMQGTLAQSPKDVDTHLRLEQVRRRRIELAALLAKFEIVKELETTVSTMGADAPIKLRERYALSLAEVGRVIDAQQQFKEIAVIDPTNAAAQEWLRTHPSADEPGTPN